MSDSLLHCQSGTTAAAEMHGGCLQAGSPSVMCTQHNIIERTKCAAAHEVWHLMCRYQLLEGTAQRVFIAWPAVNQPGSKVLAYSALSQPGFRVSAVLGRHGA